MNRFLSRRGLVFAAVGALAGVVALVLILVSVLGSSGGKKASTTTAATTTATTSSTDTTATTTTTVAPLPDAADSGQLLRGIPQKLNALGKANAPETMVEFADIQCPYCRDYILDALPGILDRYVRPGKLRLVFNGMYFVGNDSEKALRAVYAAGLQGKLWNFLDLLYRHQGAENSGWVTDDLLRRVGASIPGFDTAKMLTDMSSKTIDDTLAAGNQLAATAGVNSTPTFYAGPTHGTLNHVPVTSLTLAGFRPVLDALTG